jgi:hypothetical protein
MDEIFHAQSDPETSRTHALCFSRHPCVVRDFLDTPELCCLPIYAELGADVA